MLAIKNLSKYFYDNTLPALKNINIEINGGQFCVIIGNNGSGKSTLIRCISGNSYIRDGNIFLDNKEITNKDSSKIIATVVQDTNKGTIGEMTLLENMVLALTRGHKASFQFYKKYKHDFIKMLQKLNIGLEDYIDKPMNSLSGGQKQMVATIMAIKSKPKILLLDEHTSALDPKTETKLMEYTSELVKDEKITTLMVTHKLNDAIKYGDRLIMLQNGSVVLDVSGKKKSLLKKDELLKLFHKYEDITLCQ